MELTERDLAILKLAGKFRFCLDSVDMRLTKQYIYDNISS